MIPATQTLVDAHPDAEQIRSLLVDWGLQPSNDRPPFAMLAQEIVDRYGGDLGKNPASTLDYFFREHVASKLQLSTSWAIRGAVEAGMDLNLLRQHQKTLDAIDKALAVAQARVESSEEGEGTGNLLSLLERREATLKAIQELQMVLGVLEDKRVEKKANLHYHEHVDADTRGSVMDRVKRGAKKHPVLDVGR